MVSTLEPPRTLHGGTFNLKYGRSPEKVAREITEFTRKHHLSFLCVQEATGYFNVLHDLADFDYYAKPSGKDPVSGTGPQTGEVGILVHRRHRVSRVRYGSYGDGWTTVRGGHHPGPLFPRLSIDGWLRVGALHLPTPSDWPHGHLVAPTERVDDYVQMAQALKKFMAVPLRARLVAGDWNEPPDTTGLLTPRDIAVKTRSRLAVPTSRLGHGRIDYAMYKNCTVYGVSKDLKLPEGSDHEPVHFVVRAK